MGLFWGGGFEVMFFLVFFLVIAVFAVTLVRGISQWNKNNHSPRLTVDATVVAKRSDVSHHHHHHGDGHMSHTTTSTTYFVIFQVDSGDRMELPVGMSLECWRRETAESSRSKAPVTWDFSASKRRGQRTIQENHQHRGAPGLWPGAPRCFYWI